MLARSPSLIERRRRCIFNLTQHDTREDRMTLLQHLRMSIALQLDAISFSNFLPTKMAEAEAASNSTGVSPKEQRARTPQKPRLRQIFLLLDIDRLIDLNRNTAQMVTLYCGQSPEAIPHLVHKDFAIHYSPVLKAAFASPFIEGQTQVYRFEDTTDGALQYLVNWIYTQDVVVPRSIEELAKDKSLMDAECMILCDLWVLADKMRMPQLQNKVMDELNQINIQTVRCPTGCIPYVWDNTAKGSLLRLWFLKHYA